MSSLAPNHYLPNELLLVIFDYLEYDDLYQLTQTSPRFNHLSLLVYFAKRKVQITPNGQIDFPNAMKTMDMLPFIRKATFINFINRLSCGLVQPHKSLLENISHLIAILQNVKSVEEFIIDFYVSGESWNSSMIKQVNAGNALVNALGELFTTAARVSRLVMVRNGTALRAVLQKAEKGDARGRGLSWSFGQVARLFTSDKPLKRTSTPAITGPSEAPYQPITASTKGALRALEINSIILVSPPFLGWTIQTLNTNQVTDLTFGTVEYREVDWSTLLSQLHIPTLRSLTFRGYTPFDSLIDFMARHQSITTLTVNNINMDEWHRRDASALPNESCEKLVKAFKNVRRLTCCPQGLVVLLSDLLDAEGTILDLFPSLRTISVLWSIGIGQQLKLLIVGEILAPIAAKLKSYERVVFVVTYRADAGASWRTPPIPGLSAPVRRALPIGNMLPPYRSTLTTNTNPTSIASGQNNATVSTNNPSFVFTAFTEIKLELTPRADKEGIPDLVKNLAESFTSVKHFKIDTHLRAGRPSQENKIWKLFLCHHVLKQFKHLRAVYVDGVRSRIVEREESGA